MEQSDGIGSFRRKIRKKIRDGLLHKTQRPPRAEAFVF